LNYQFTDVTEINNPASSYSQTFRVPMTAGNQDILGAFSIGHIPELDYKQKIPARISRGGITLMDGFAQVKSFYVQRGQFQDAELVVFGEIANLSRSIGDKMLQDLDLSAYNFALNASNTSAGLSSAGVASGRIRLGVVDRFGFGTLNPFNGSIYFTPADMTPFVQASFILDEIMTAAGLTWESNFIQGATFAKLYLMALSGEQLYTIAEAQTQAVSVGQDSEQTIPSSTWTELILSETSPYYDDISAWATDTFTAPVTGFYRFVLTAGHTADIDVSFRVTGSVGGTMFTTDLYAGQQAEWTIDLDLQASETVTFAVYAETASSFDILADLLLVQYYQSEGFTLNVARNLPEMRQIDFVSGLQKMFNLVFIADRNRPTHFYIEPWSDYMSAGQKKDWTSKINTASDVVISPTTDVQKRRYVWRATESEDQINALAKSASGEVYGAKIVEDSSNDFAAGALEVVSPFAPFIVAPVAATGIPVAKITTLEGGRIKKPKPFLAFFNGLLGGAVYYNIGGAQTNKPLPYYSATEKLTSTLDDISLHYGHPTPYHFVFATPLNGLYYRWWSAWANELFSSDGRFLEAHFYLTPSDIAAFEWSDKIYLFNQYWRVLEIKSYDASQDGLTRVKLIKILGAIQDCEQLPSTGSRGLIQGTPTSLSKKCCERYGFVFDPTTKRCNQPPTLQL
jgi:hypothetical protein